MRRVTEEGAELCGGGSQDKTRQRFRSRSRSRFISRSRYRSGHGNVRKSGNGNANGDVYGVFDAVFDGAAERVLGGGRRFLGRRRGRGPRPLAQLDRGALVLAVAEVAERDGAIDAGDRGQPAQPIALGERLAVEGGDDVADLEAG